MCLSLLFSFYYAGIGMERGFSGKYVIQDDARLHVFWMQRYVDPELFQNDLIADYYSSVAPPGYTLVYKVAAAVGIHPLVLHKILPMALGLLTTAFCFGICMQLLRVPAAAFVASLLLTQSLWMRDALISGTPRAFSHPLILAFLYFSLSGAWPLSVLSVALLGLFYPSFNLIAMAIMALRLLRFENMRLRMSRTRTDYLAFVSAVVVTLVVGLIYYFKSSEFGPVVTASEAKASAEFLQGGRVAFFHESFLRFWITGQHSGIISPPLFSPAALAAGLLLPFLFFFPNRFPLVRRISESIKLLPVMLIASLGLFFTAHMVIFRLFLPTRFTTHTLRIALCLSAGLALIVLFDAMLDWAKAASRARQFFAAGIIAACAIFIVSYPAFLDDFPKTRYITGTEPSLYEFFSSQPKDALIASLEPESDNLPSFAARAVLIGREYALPFHKNYYDRIRERALDLIAAQYTPDIAGLQGFIRKYGVDFFLIDRNAFEPDYISKNRWGRVFRQAASDAKAKLKEGARPAMESLLTRSVVFETEDLIVLSARRMEDASP
ncbi:MAG: hypothetical protein WBV94_10285 [Blastocatellia bacterium]